jgi:8-oxo-dGTP pyrophosphatase MutT (NUDIX family)
MNLDVPFSEFTRALSRRLAEPLPGFDAHRQMASASRLKLLQQPNERTRRSAVLILFYPYLGEVHVPFILRPAYEGVHGGQVAFPGGRMERSDESLIRTALREAQEEIGIRVSDVTVLGQLTELFIPPSNFMVLPVVGCMNRKPEFYPDPHEVDAVFEVTLAELADDRIRTNRTLNVRGVPVDAPGFVIQDYYVWGATAMMMAELLEVVRSAQGVSV